MKEEQHTTEIREGKTRERTKKIPRQHFWQPLPFFFNLSENAKENSSHKWADDFLTKSLWKKRNKQTKPLAACDELVLAQYFFFASQATTPVLQSAPSFLNGTSRWWEHKKISYPFCTTIRQMRERAKTRVRKRRKKNAFTARFWWESGKQWKRHHSWQQRKCGKG